MNEKYEEIIKEILDHQNNTDGKSDQAMLTEIFKQIPNKPVEKQIDFQFVDGGTF